MPPVATVETHSIPCDAPARRGTRQTLCGRFVPTDQHADVPSCPTCAELVRAHGDALEQLQQMSSTPDQLVPFNPTAD